MPREVYYDNDAGDVAATLIRVGGAAMLSVSTTILGANT
jgi:hypothetical protein